MAATTDQSQQGIRPASSQATYSGEAEVRPAYNNTDVLYQENRVYIEGVQVPFINASVSQVYGELPTASIDIPPESGLLDITRGYQPKVHIFYQDRIAGGWRLLFWGVITSSSYGRDRDPGSSYITFNCVHKNFMVRSVLLDYSGWIQTDSTELQDSEAALKAVTFNSNEAIVEALRGVTGIATNTLDVITPKVALTDIRRADPSKVPPNLTEVYDRLIGVPGVAVNLWNQLKKAAYSNPSMNLNMSSMAVPLVEEALGFFKRMSGHRYLEYALQFSKEAYCHEGGEEKSVIVPPAFQNPLLSAVKAEIAVNTVRTQITHSGEYTDYLTLLQTFLNSICYDLVTLSSPSEVSQSPLVGDVLPDSGYSGKSRVAVETIIKPQIPFYYAPVCNVLLPRTYSSVILQQQESSVPTRILAYHSVDATGGNNQLYRGPHSIRESTAYGSLLKAREQTAAPVVTLSSTFGISYNVPGKYEQGSGIRPTKTALPWWLATFAISQPTNTNNAEKKPDIGTPAYIEALTLAAAWDERYSRDMAQQPASGQDVRPINLDKEKLNPFNMKEPTVDPFQRLLITTLDYEYSKAVVSARSGSVDALFNPYMVPGYPMDIIDDSPNHPCFHALCTSITHTLTPSSASSSIGMSAVTTYSELSNFYHPPVHPSLQTTLRVTNATIPDSLSKTYGDATGLTDIKATILQNPIAKATADEFYSSVFGVCAAAPDELFDFASGRVNGLTRSSGYLVPMGVMAGTKKASMKSSNGGELNDYLTSVGNLRLIHRKVETKASIEGKFGYSFIDLTPANYNESVLKYVLPITASGLLLEPGASMFLNYLETKDFINLCKKNDLT